ncbi:hypothetical protein D7X25_13560 [bacterium 1XD42-8]|jgi:spore maturation protein CgeB|nr:glycosyltransferase [Lachnospiraceae bacterium]RKJ52942.1 hypothetical protein D7X25_13560 [bacterium 1XD42-8]
MRNSTGVLLYQWDAYGERSLEKALREKGCYVNTFKKTIHNHLEDKDFLEEISNILKDEKMEVVISFDFFPMIAEACKETKKIYISWVFGCPHYSLYCEPVFYEGNFIFCFDRQQCNELKKWGVKNAYHLPLAVDSEMFMNTIEKQKKDYWKNIDVSFVGSLYTDERNYFEQIPYLPDYVKGYIEGLCEAQLKIYGYSLVGEVIPDNVWEDLKKYVSFSMDSTCFLPFEVFMENTIYKKITVMERSRIMKVLSENFKTTIYTTSSTSHLPHIHKKGYVDYYNEMPSVFYNSKLNVNITLRSISSGIPLRALDILACQGCLVTNYQPEIAENFEDGKEVILFGSIEELLDKCAYYLKKDDERKRIARNGWEKVISEFSYKKQLDKIFQTI